MINLEKILNKKTTIVDSKNYIASINENQCIGCTKCIKACPFDAIVGSSKFMHSILANECTGCGFCVEPCPVDCISMLKVDNNYLPNNPFLSNTGNLQQDCENHAQIRFEAKKNRLNTENTKITIEKKHISILDIKHILLNAKNKTKAKYQKVRVTILNNELQQQIILKDKQKSLKRKLSKHNFWIILITDWHYLYTKYSFFM